MGLRIVERKARRTKASISISGRYNRLLIFQKAYALMKEKCGADFHHVQFLVDDVRRGFFWMRPCKETDTGATPITTKTGNNRILSVSALLSELEWSKEAKTATFNIDYDNKNHAWLVNTNAPLALPPSEN